MSRTERRRRGLLTALTAGAALLPAGPAAAFCLARSCDPDAQAGEGCAKDAAGCSIAGLPLRRSSPCIDIGVARGSGLSLGIGDAELAQIVTAAFARWTAVDCGGGPPAVAVRSLGAVAAPAPFACTTDPDLNLDVWHVSGTGFPTASGVTMATGAIAGRTRASFLEADGRVFDADVELNQLWLALHDRDPQRLRAILRTVATHEAGHALGLAHSQDVNALMYRSYAAAPDRALSPDDVAGLCALYPPAPLQCPPAAVPAAGVDAAACEMSATEGAGGGCSIAAHGVVPTRLPWLILLLLQGASARRRTPRRL